MLQSMYIRGMYISLQLLHEKMDHISAEKMVKNKIVTGIKLSDLDRFEYEAYERKTIKKDFSVCCTSEIRGRRSGAHRYE